MLDVLVHPPMFCYIRAVCLPYGLERQIVARQVRNAKLDSRTARARLPRRREPFGR
jgi:hypothetical protein